MKKSTSRDKKVSLTFKKLANVEGKTYLVGDTGDFVKKQADYLIKMDIAS